MNERGHYGSRRSSVGADAAPTPAPPSGGFSWGGLLFFGLAGGGMLLLARPHYQEVKKLEQSLRTTARAAGTIGASEEPPLRFRKGLPAQYR